MIATQEKDAAIYLAEQSEQAVRNANAAGMTVIVRGDWDLLVDLDDFNLAHFKKRLDTLDRLPGARRPLSWHWWHSKSGGLHVHVKLAQDGTPPTPIEAVALQSALGSDHKREMLAAIGAVSGSQYYSVLFQPAGAVVTEGLP